MPYYSSTVSLEVARCQRWTISPAFKVGFDVLSFKIDAQLGIMELLRVRGHVYYDTKDTLRQNRDEKM